MAGLMDNFKELIDLDFKPLELDSNYIIFVKEIDGRILKITLILSMQSEDIGVHANWADANEDEEQYDLMSNKSVVKALEKISIRWGRIINGK